MKVTDECIACGTCTDACEYGAIIEAEDIYMITDDCTECGLCVGICPVEAIIE